MAAATSNYIQTHSSAALDLQLLTFSEQNADLIKEIRYELGQTLDIEGKSAALREQRERVRVELLTETVRQTATQNPKKNKKNLRTMPSMDDSLNTTTKNEKKVKKKQDMRGFGRSDSNSIAADTRTLKSSQSSNLERSLKTVNRAKKAAQRGQRVSDGGDDSIREGDDDHSSDESDDDGFDSRRQTESSTFFEEDPGRSSPKSGAVKRGRQRAGGGHPSDLPPTPKAMLKMIPISDELIAECAPTMNSVVSLVNKMKLQNLDAKRAMNQRMQEERQMKAAAQQQEMNTRKEKTIQQGKSGSGRSR